VTGKGMRVLLLTLAGVLLGSLLVSSVALGQTYSIRVGVNPGDVHKSGIFFKSLESVDITVEWQVRDENDAAVTLDNVQYKVWVASDQSYAGDALHYCSPDLPTGSHSHPVSAVKACTMHYVRVQAIDARTHTEVAVGEAEFRYCGEEAGDTDSGRISLRKMFADAWKSGAALGRTTLVVLVGLALLAFAFGIKSWHALRSFRLFPTKGEVIVGNNKKRYEATEKAFGEILGAITTGVSDQLKQEDVAPVIRKHIAHRGTFYGNVAGRILLRFRPAMPRARARKRRPFEDLPTVKILRAGVKAADDNGDRKEVQRAMEDRALAEIENLRKQSVVELLWHIGFTQPLLGLFGTVTGLAAAFLKWGSDPQKFAGAISVALATTILGLLTGIPIMLAYYYYSFKIDRTRSLWEVMCVEVSENLRVGKADHTER